MFRLKFQQLIIFFCISLVTALFIYNEPAFARKNQKSEESSSNSNAQQSQPQSNPSNSSARAQTPASSAQSARASARSISSAPAPRVQTQPRINTAPSMPTTRTQPSQSLNNSRNSISINRNNSISPSRPSITPPSITPNTRNTVRLPSSSAVTPRISPTPGTNQSTSSIRNNITLNLPSTSQSRQITTNLNNNRSLNQNNSNRITSTPPSYTARQPAESSNNRISSNLSSRIGGSISTDESRLPNLSRKPTTNVRNRISSDITSRIGSSITEQSTFPTNIGGRTTANPTNRLDSHTDSLIGTTRTLPPTGEQRPAAGSINRISSNTATEIGDIISNQRTSSTIDRAQNSGQQNNRNNNRADNSNGSQRNTISTSSRRPSVSSNNRINSNGNSSDTSQTRSIQENRIRISNPTNGRLDANNRVNNTRALENTELSEGISEQLSRNSRILEQVNRRNNVESTQTDNRENQTNNRARNANNNRANNNRALENTDTAENAQGLIRENRITNEIDAEQTQIGQRANRKAPQDQTTVVDDTVIDQTTRDHRYTTYRPSRLIYRDRPYYRDPYSYEHIYVDTYSNVRTITIWPSYSYVVCYNRGSWFSFRHVYPFYHRKYIFISLGGYWPSSYRYVRYYWYGCHPYYWYGYHPIPREVKGDTNNYYTYNYYYSDDAQTSQSGRIASSDYYDNIGGEEFQEPAMISLADKYFEEAVDAFENNNYSTAVEKFAEAMEIATEDIILPFAYCQALFANGQYYEAAENLRMALKKVDPDNEGVFFPRGLYPDEEVLLIQLDRLAEQADHYSFDADLQLLLGYQLLGIGNYDKAFAPLSNASLDKENSEAATVLLRLLEKINIPEDEDIFEEITAPEAETSAQEMQETDIINLKSPLIETPDINNGVDVIEDINNEAIPIQSQITKDEFSTRTKSAVLVATLLVVIGSTGIGHFIKH